MEKSSAKTLMIDSGVGGLSVLAWAHQKLPDENITFFADAGNAPYGDKNPEMIRSYLNNIINRYSIGNIKAILLACNTATSAAAAMLRETLPIPVIGMEPALKPAVLNTKGQIVVMATSLTIREEKFRKLLELYGTGRTIVPLPCSGLMNLVEEDPESSETEKYIQTILAPYISQTEAIVLGCTHYVFLRPIFQKIYPHIKLFDGNEGVVGHFEKILEQNNLTGGQGQIEIECSIRSEQDKTEYLKKCEKMLRFGQKIYQQPLNY